MNREEIEDRARQSEWPDAEPAEQPYERRVMEELEAHRFFDPASVRWYRSAYSDHNLDGEQDLGDVEFLHERGWVVECDDGLAPTRAAVLVFGRSRYVLQVLPRPVIDYQFIGATYDQWSPDLRWIDRIVVEENLLQAWLILVQRYFRHAESPFRLDMRTMRRDDRPPGYVSFREAVINQLIHQDYGDHGRTPFIRFYRDRMVFWNPGDSNVPVGDLLDRTAKEVRNPLIAAAFRSIGLAEQAGTGIRAIFGNWRGLGHAPPVIRNDRARNAFEISLLAEASREDMGSDHADHVDGDLDGDQVAVRLTSRQRAIVEACDVPRSMAELMQRAGVSHRSHFRRKHLKPLLEAGLVRMTNPDNPRAPNQKYVVADVVVRGA